MNKLFLELLNDSDNVDESDICLISHEKKDESYIKLQCDHGFNFTHLFEEVKNQKSYSKYNYNQLKLWQLRCPYCRSIQNKLLPQREGYPKLNGINSPKRYIMYLNKCSYIFKRGKRKNQQCNEACEYTYCKTHMKYDSMNKCCYIFKKGSNKGQTCGNDCKEIYCKNHIKYKIDP